MTGGSGGLGGFGGHGGFGGCGGGGVGGASVGVFGTSVGGTVTVHEDALTTYEIDSAGPGGEACDAGGNPGNTGPQSNTWDTTIITPPIGL